MKVLSVLAHQNTTSFTAQLSGSFNAGVLSQVSSNIRVKNIFHDSFEDIKESVAWADHLCFAFPLWFEMPPSELVKFFQQTFVLGFAFEYVDGKRILLIDKKATFLVSMGQNKSYNSCNLQEAMQYSGIVSKFATFHGVGPSMSTDLAETYKNLAYRLGVSACR